MSGSKLQIELEGPLVLTMKSISFEAPGSSGGSDYVLWLQSLALGFFGLSFPPSGRTDLLLFAKAEASKPMLGWYAVYDKESGGSGGGAGTQRTPSSPALIAGRDR
jgi:hypothetical protein